MKYLKNKIMKKALIVFGILFLVIIFIKWFFPIYQVSSDSMEPTFITGDYIIVSKLHYNFFDEKINDIVLFEPVKGVFENEYGLIGLLE